MVSADKMHLTFNRSCANIHAQCTELSNTDFRANMTLRRKTCTHLLILSPIIGVLEAYHVQSTNSMYRYAQHKAEGGSWGLCSDETPNIPSTSQEGCWGLGCRQRYPGSCSRFQHALPTEYSLWHSMPCTCRGCLFFDNGASQVVGHGTADRDSALLIHRHAPHRVPGGPS